MRTRAPLLGLPLLLLPGCITVGVAASEDGPEDRFHALDAPVLPEVRCSSRGTSVAIRTFSARQRYDERVVVREPDDTLTFREYERWAEAPDLAVTDSVREALATGGYCHVIFPAQEGYNADVVLDGFLLAFEVVASAEGPDTTHVRLRLDVGDPAAGDLVWSGVYEGRAPLPGEGFDGLGPAMERALGTALAAALTEWEAHRVLARFSGSPDPAAD